MVRDGQMDGSQKLDLISASAPELMAEANAGPAEDEKSLLQVRPRRSRSEILRRMVFAEDADEDAKDSEGVSADPFSANRGVRGGDADLARRGRRECPPPSSPSSSSPWPVSWRIGERPPTRMRPERKRSSAELMPVPATRWRADANSKSPAHPSPSAWCTDAAEEEDDAGGERRM